MRARQQHIFAAARKHHGLHLSRFHDDEDFSTPRFYGIAVAARAPAQNKESTPPIRSEIDARLGGDDIYAAVERCDRDTSAQNNTIRNLSPIA